MKMLPFALLALAGCTTIDHREPQTASECGVTDQAQRRFIGTKFREQDRMALQHETGAPTARVLRPGDAATMDFRPDRLNILVDDDGQVAGLRCG